MMAKQYILFLQCPKPKRIGIGVLSVDAQGEAHFFSDLGDRNAQLLACMERVRLDFAGADGLMLSGMEHVGFDKYRQKEFRYQQWWLTYKVAEEKQ